MIRAKAVEAMKTMGITQEQLARRLDCVPRTVSRFLAGKPCEFSTAMKIAKELNLSGEDLFSLQFGVEFLRVRRWQQKCLDCKDRYDPTVFYERTDSGWKFSALGLAQLMYNEENKILTPAYRREYLSQEAVDWYGFVNEWGAGKNYGMSIAAMEKLNWGLEPLIQFLRQNDRQYFSWA